MQITDSVAVVTGAAGGIGRATASRSLFGRSVGLWHDETSKQRLRRRAGGCA
jgi:NAD(P)-dependent dehydrogenase (short-subunit alcohol dehydrogenase family)